MITGDELRLVVISGEKWWKVVEGGGIMFAADLAYVGRADAVIKAVVTRRHGSRPCKH